MKIVKNLRKELSHGGVIPAGWRLAWYASAAALAVTIHARTAAPRAARGARAGNRA